MTVRNTQNKRDNTDEGNKVDMELPPDANIEASHVLYH